MKKLPPIPPFHERHPVFVVTLVYAVMSFTAHLSRAYWFRSVLPGSTPYFHMKLSQLLLVRGIEQTENLLGFARPFFVTPFHVLSANLAYFLGPFRVAQIIPVVFGALIIFTSWSILQKLKVPVRQSFYSVLFLVLSPVFITLSLTYTPESLAVLLLLLGIRLLLADEKLAIPFGMLALWATALMGPIWAFASAAFAFALIRFRPGRSRPLAFAGFLAIFIFVLRAGLFVSRFGYPDIFLQDPFLLRTFTILGAHWGFGLFALFLGFGGIVSSWKKKFKLWPIYSIILVLIALSAFGLSSSNVVLSVILAGFAGFMVDVLLKRVWALSFIKGLTVWLVICGILFTGVLQMSVVVRSEPHPDQITGLTALSELCAPKDIVLSHSSRGFWIESIAGCAPLLDESTAYMDEERYIDAETIFQTKDLNTARELFDKYEIKYVLVDKTMKDGLVWDDEDDGLLFLFRNNETFKNAYYYPSIEIWEII